MYSPIALFVYNRPDHFKRTIDSLIINDLALKSDLIIFSDGAKDITDEKSVQKVREIIKEIQGFKSVKSEQSDINKGLAKSIIYGVTNTVKKFGRIIVLEDDMIVSPYFLNFMNEALDIYEREENVISIHGYIYPVKKQLPETFFLRGADCWGWATWKRGWDFFEEDSNFLIEQIDKSKLQKEFDLGGSVKNYRMLKNQREGKIDSWAIRWHASAFIKNKLTLYPGKSLVKNIGTDGLGTHLGSTNVYDTFISEGKVNLKKIPLEVNKLNEQIISEYFRSIKFKSRVSGLKKRLGI